MVNTGTKKRKSTKQKTLNGGGCPEGEKIKRPRTKDVSIEVENECVDAEIDNNVEVSSGSDDETPLVSDTHPAESDGNNFLRFMQREFSDEDAAILSARNHRELVKTTAEWHGLGRCIHFDHPDISRPISPDLSVATVAGVSMVTPLTSTWAKVNSEFVSCDSEFSATQGQLYKLLNSYKDVLYPNYTYRQRSEVLPVICAHVVNHVIRSRALVKVHNRSLEEAAGVGSTVETPEYRDQGLTRPKVLILSPLRGTALRIVNTLTSLLETSSKTDIGNKHRFLSEFGSEPANSSNKPEDYQDLFASNSDDDFRLGLVLSSRSLRLYSQFYDSDVIIASPLGLRRNIEKSLEQDFLSSIEVLLLDHADVFLMQNWDHLLFVLRCLNEQPREPHGVDFSRVWSHCVAGWSRLFRQTVVLSSVITPELNNIVSKHSTSYNGKVVLNNPVVTGTMLQVLVNLSHVFNYIECADHTELPDTRFEYFTQRILPLLKDSPKSRTLVFIPSTFDFIRVRNHFRHEELSFAVVNEYSDNKEMVEGRKDFYNERKTYLLYTERCHFFRRYQLKGVHHIIFYELPMYPQFYAELCNLIGPSVARQPRLVPTVTVLYSRYEAHRLAGVVGTQRTTFMLTKEQEVSMFATGEQ